MAASEEARKDLETPLEEPVEEDSVPAETAAEEPEAETETAPEGPGEAERLRAEKQELEDRYLRLMAEFGNFRNRTAKEKESIREDTVASTLRQLLPVLDNFQRAMESPCTDEAYRQGIELIYRGLWDAMTAMGVEEIAEAGVPFDPDIHNAVMHIEDEALPKNSVAQVMQKGYRMGGRILRYAMVQAAN